MKVYLVVEWMSSPNWVFLPGDKTKNPCISGDFKQSQTVLAQGGLRHIAAFSRPFRRRRQNIPIDEFPWCPPVVCIIKGYRRYR